MWTLPCPCRFGAPLKRLEVRLCSSPEQEVPPPRKHLEKKQPAVPSQHQASEESDRPMRVKTGKGERKGEGHEQKKQVTRRCAVPNADRRVPSLLIWRTHLPQPVPLHVRDKSPFAADSYPPMFSIRTQNLLYSKIKSNPYLKDEPPSGVIIYGTLSKAEEGSQGWSDVLGRKQLSLCALGWPFLPLLDLEAPSGTHLQ